MMKPVFDENGLAIKAGYIRWFYYCSSTGEYTGLSDEYINIGVSMPGHSTDIEPGETGKGKVSLFTGVEWRQEEDHRGEIVYSTIDGLPLTINYIGALRVNHTNAAPTTPFDMWNGKEWVIDTAIEHAAGVAALEAEKKARIDQVNEYLNSKQWPGKAAIGRLNETEKAQYNLWLDYLDELWEVDTGNPLIIKWPAQP